MLEAGKLDKPKRSYMQASTRFESRIMLREGGWYVETESAIVITSGM